MRRLFCLVATACVLSACVAETVERRHPRHGPIKEVGYVELGGGRVRYSSEGWQWIVASRRRLALKLMSRNCGRDLTPKITDEFTRQDADAPYAGQDITSSLASGNPHYLIERYVHITYECQAAGTTETAVSSAAVRAPILVVDPIVQISTGVSR
jgi:hypothetical protein